MWSHVVPVGSSGLGGTLKIVVFSSGSSRLHHPSSFGRAQFANECLERTGNNVFFQNLSCKPPLSGTSPAAQAGVRNPHTPSHWFEES